MPNLIEVNTQSPQPGRLRIRVGDMLVFSASGGRVTGAEQVVELLGPFYPGFLSTDGTVVTPAGSPDKVCFVGRSAGTVDVVIISGDAWHNRNESTYQVIVEASG